MWKKSINLIIIIFFIIINFANIDAKEIEAKTTAEILDNKLGWSISIPNLSAKDYTLPIYELEIDSSYLIELYANPEEDTYYPAIFTYQDYQYECEVRFRGATALHLPKKSWRIKFDDTNIFDAEKINLNAEYRDNSIMRNHIAMKLFQYLGYPAPNTEYISFFVNGDYMGVFLQIEEVNEDFLERNNRISNNLYKAKDHAASMSPLTSYDAYYTSWDKKIGDELDYTDIQFLFNQFFYSTDEDFEILVNEEINIDNILNYFAIEFVLVSLDCFTKNLYLYFNPESNQYEIFAWDNDATFGNDWNGDYQTAYISQYQTPLDYQILFQRMMENDNWRDTFWNKVDNITNDGFTYLSTEIDTTYALIKNDIYQDNNKICTNQEFDEEIECLHNFLIERASFLDGFSCFNRISLSNFYCSSAYPTEDNQEIIFRVESDEAQSVYIEYIRDLDFDEWADPITIEILELFDDGNHNDFDEGDLIYANSLTFADTITGLFPFCFKGSEFYYPANDFFYLSYIRTNTLALNKTITPQDIIEQLRIGNIYKIETDYFIELYNKSLDELDLSYCYIQAGNYYQNFLLAENTILHSGDTLIITSNKIGADYYFEDLQVFGNLFYEISIGDTIKILSPSLNTLLYKVCEQYSPLENPDIIINEINYNSSSAFDTQDWVEFYNPQNYSVDLSNWYFKDAEDEHIFVFPDNTIIEPEGYIILCEDKIAFNNLFPDVDNYIGDFDFGLSGAGELIRLYNIFDTLIDSVMYDDELPWSPEADGNGATLELINPKLDNALSENWSASLNYGTPATQNSIFSDTMQSLPISFALEQNYPNPFNSLTEIPFSLLYKTFIRLNIYNLRGELVKTLLNGNYDAGYYTIQWDGTDNEGKSIGSGIYFYNLKADNYTKTHRMLMIK